MRSILLIIGLVVVSMSASCRSAEDKAAGRVHDLFVSEIDEFVAAAAELEDAASEATWDPQTVVRMRAAWRRTNLAFERIEGPLAPIFPDLTLSIDDRYEAQLRGRMDPNPFDDNGIRGIRAVERILWADSIPASVMELERTLPGFAVARFPANANERADFKMKLCHHILEDARRLQADWTAQKPDLSFALDAIYWGIKEQRIEITKAATHDEESAYAQASMAVLRANLEGTRAVYSTIRPLVLSRGAADADRDLEAVFDDLSSGLPDRGDSLPPPPTTWSSEHPSAEDLASPFGKLHTSIDRAFDPTRASSAPSALRRMGRALGLAYVPPT